MLEFPVISEIAKFQKNTATGKLEADSIPTTPRGFGISLHHAYNITLLFHQTVFERHTLYYTELVHSQLPSNQFVYQDRLHNLRCRLLLELLLDLHSISCPVQVKSMRLIVSYCHTAWLLGLVVDLIFWQVV